MLQNATIVRCHCGSSCLSLPLASFNVNIRAESRAPFVFSQPSSPSDQVAGSGIVYVDAGIYSLDEMRGDDIDKLPRCDHLRLLPELREMPPVAGHQIVGAGGIGASINLLSSGSLVTWSARDGFTRCDRLRMSLRSCCRSPCESSAQDAPVPRGIRQERHQKHIA
jgi:hypothetical protein